MRSDLAAIYARYSPRPQKKRPHAGDALDDPDSSIQVQLEHCRRYCAHQKLQIGREFLEPGVSGYKSRLREREEGAKLLAAVARGEFRHVVVMRLDRLSRRTADILNTVDDWNDAGVHLHLADQGGNSVDASTPEGYLFITLLAGIGQFERQMTARRTSQAMSRRARLFVPTGACKIPWGYMPGADRAVVTCPAEVATAVEIHTLFGAGLSYRKIGRALEARGILCRGKRWHPDTIRGIVQTPLSELQAVRSL
jgi:DNA invertase Pin-like site-specific DNA recombinase